MKSINLFKSCKKIAAGGGYGAVEHQGYYCGEVGGWPDKICLSLQALF